MTHVVSSVVCCINELVEYPCKRGPRMELGVYITTDVYCACAQFRAASTALAYHYMHRTARLYIQHPAIGRDDPGIQ